MKISKIILGAKNSDTKTFKNIITPYILAGADIIDVCADKKIIALVRKIISDLHPQNIPLICSSITLCNDIHSLKAKVNKNLCSVCGRCNNVCPQKTIKIKNNDIKIDEAGCIGCQKCAKLCPNNAIEFYNLNCSFDEQFEQAKSADYIEIHTNGEDENLYDVFEFLNKNYEGKIGICISKCNSINKKIKIIETVKTIISPKCLILQADGNSISGFNNEISTTMTAIKEAEMFQNIKNVTLILSGGTNEKTAELARKYDIKFDGIAWGSYARKIITEADMSKKLKFAGQLIQSLQ